jgi:hypothetical protein
MRTWMVVGNPGQAGLDKKGGLTMDIIIMSAFFKQMVCMNWKRE